MCARENLFPILLHLSCLHFHKNVQSLSPHLIHFPILTKTFSCYPLIWYFHKKPSVVIPSSDIFRKNFQLLSPHLIFSQKLSVVILPSDTFSNVHKKLSVIIPPSDTFSVVIPHLIFSQKHSVVIAPSDTFSNIEVCLKASYAFFKIQNNAETKLHFHWERSYFP